MEHPLFNEKNQIIEKIGKILEQLNPEDSSEKILEYKLYLDQNFIQLKEVDEKIRLNIDQGEIEQFNKKMGKKISDILDLYYRKGLLFREEQTDIGNKLKKIKKTDQYESKPRFFDEKI